MVKEISKKMHPVSMGEIFYHSEMKYILKMNGLNSDFSILIECTDNYYLKPI